MLLDENLIPGRQTVVNTGKLNTRGYRNGILIPMYVYPANVYTNVDYNTLIDLKKEYHSVPFIAILNPSNGPGNVVDGNYTAAIKRLHGAGIKVMGYVSTSYTVISEGAVKSDIDKWQELYPDIDSIFLDEMTNDDDREHSQYYARLTTYSHDKGLYPVIANPGSLPNYRYYEEKSADVIITVEGSSVPAEASLLGDFADGNASYDYMKRGGLMYNQGSFSVSDFDLLCKYLGWVYITDDNLPNPWDTVSPYMEAMLNHIQGPMATGAVQADADETKFSHKLPVTIDGTDYYIMLTQT